MFKFGKKVNYRPIIVSLLIALVPGFAAKDIWESSLAGFLGGLLFFLLIFLGHYWRVTSLLFNYWEIDKDKIKYNDVTNIWTSLLMISVPFAAPFKTIDLKSIKSVSIVGDLDKLSDIPFSLPFTVGLSMFSSGISISNHQVGIQFTLKDGSSVTLSIARDFVYNRLATINKIDKLFKKLDDAGVHVDTDSLTTFNLLNAVQKPILK